MHTQFSYSHSCLVKSDILCVSFDTLGFRHAMTMAFAIDEINNNSDLLPNVTLGYILYDNCGALVVGFTGALSLASGREGQFLLQENCLGSPPVLGIVGDHYSTFSIAMANVLGLYKMPIVSFLSLISCSVVFLVYIYRLSLSLTLLKYDCLNRLYQAFDWVWVDSEISCVHLFFHR